MGPGACPPCPRGRARGPSGASALGRELDCLTWGWRRTWREGACLGLGDQSRPVSRGQCSGVPGTLQSRQRLELPVSRGAASWPLLCVPSLVCPEGPAPSTAWDCAGRRDEAVGRRGKSQLEERRLGAQERKGEARASLEERRLRAQEWNSKKPWDDEARAAASWSSSVERRGKSELGAEEGPSGQRAFPGQGTFRVPRLALRWATSLCAGLGLCCGWPFALVLLWLRGERGNPVRRVRAPVSAAETEEKQSSPGPQPSYPVSRAGLFPSPGSFLPAAGPWPA
ncbi:uncharacterized protein LOC128786844 [Vidua chalybeata]|uniref:uncharacterized protein LOC128786844 n=1 Tax=Vidua chalybeata TaxID=81927 RepID=UPI0023A804E2|nr:uncharacterized protein LOC128786844 [Vidua chalybeata]